MVTTISGSVDTDTVLGYLTLPRIEERTMSEHIQISGNNSGRRCLHQQCPRDAQEHAPYGVQQNQHCHHHEDAGVY